MLKQPFSIICKLTCLINTQISVQSPQVKALFPTHESMSLARNINMAVLFTYLRMKSTNAGVLVHP